MDFARCEAIARAVLYEGYNLYPYRPSALKNRLRWTFGSVFPQEWTRRNEHDRSHMQTECLVRGGNPALTVRVRFLHIVAREIGEALSRRPRESGGPGADDETVAVDSRFRGNDASGWPSNRFVMPAKASIHVSDASGAEEWGPAFAGTTTGGGDGLQNIKSNSMPGAGAAFRKVAALDVDGTQWLEWEEAVEREVAVSEAALQNLAAIPAPVQFHFPPERSVEPIRNVGGVVAGLVMRTAHALAGTVALSAVRLAPDLFRLTVRIENRAPLDRFEREDRPLAQRAAFASTHTLLGVENGVFVSLLDPPAELAEAAAQCRNEGTWPVLVGGERESALALSSPIILYDNPQIAPESPGDLFDGCEIDEILTLRILTLTDAEKREMAAADPRSRALLERTEALTAEELARLHGTFRNAPPVPAPFRIGDRVRLKPKSGGDVMDVVLKDQIAVVEAVERDFDDRVHVAVTILDDPGRDLGIDRMPGHRFFFEQDEVEPVAAEEAA
ncbi:MAG TPA: hypothetical protein VFA12_07350 [Stellaceae bacterium]|nr:hypothetical protein [Stellaceae bacterium]